MRSSRILVLDPGAAHTACGLFASGSDGRLVLQQFACARLESAPAPAPHWTDQTGAAFATLAAQIRPAGGAVLAVPGHLALTKFVKTPAIQQSKRAKIIQFEASQNIPYPLEEVAWDHVVVADDGMDLEVMLMAVKTDAMLALCAAAETAGFPVRQALPACLALRQAFRHNYPDRPESALLVSIGARSTDLLFHEPGRFFVRTLPLAGNTVTQAIADELRLDFAAAEALKIQVHSRAGERPAGSPDSAAVWRATENFSARLILEITRSTLNLRRQATSTPPAIVYLTGGGSAIAPRPGLLAEKLKLPVHRFDALRRVGVAPAAALAQAPGSEPFLAVLVGLAAPLVVKEQTTETLLPPVVGQALVDRRRRRALLIAAALVALALLPPIWHYHRLALAVQSDLAAIDVQLRPLRGWQARNAGNLERIDRARQQVAALHGLAETNSNWISFLSDLQGRLAQVEDVWLEKLSVVRVPLPVSNAAPAPAAPERPPPLRLTLTGRLLDKSNPVSKVSPESNVRVRRLLDSFAGSRFIAAVENERFDNDQPGILRFDFTLVVNPENPL